ncbi:hypothetical protein AMTRI_Chr11g157970 [Amborella trichopoda]
MKDPLDRTKVVVRRLPPALTQQALMEKIDSRFSGRYKWAAFRPGKNSLKNQRHSRIYIDFKRPEDVLEFAEFFVGHVFVNEKGSQFKAVVEYAPSQRVPKPWSKKDGREGTIFKDPEYLEFLEFLAKPAENLPSAEIQLERREAERAGASKESLIVTPLMDFVRQKRAAKSGTLQRSSANGKTSRRSTGVSSTSPGSNSQKRGPERRKISTSMYVLRDSTKGTSSKDKSTYGLVPRRDEQKLPDNSSAVSALAGPEALDDESVGVADVTAATMGGTLESGKKKVLLLKGKDREASQASGSVVQGQTVSSPIRNLSGSAPFRQSQRRDGNSRMVKSILSNKDGRQVPAHVLTQTEQQLQGLSLEKDKRPPRPNSTRLASKDHLSGYLMPTSMSDSDPKKALDEKITGNDSYGLVPANEKQEKRTRNKDRPDRAVWTPLRRSDGIHTVDESQMTSDSLEKLSNAQELKLGDDTEECDGLGSNASSSMGKSRTSDLGYHNSRSGRGASSSSSEHSLNQGDTKFDTSSASRSLEMKTQGTGRSSTVSVENGSHRHAGRRSSSTGLKDADGSMNLPDGKPVKRGGIPSYGPHEKQIWVQKSGTGT